MATKTKAGTAQAQPIANRLILGMVLAVVTFWLFAQTTLNVARRCGRTWASASR